MKKLSVLFIALLGFNAAINAQSVNYKTFKVDLAIGGFPTTGAASAIGFTLEFQARTSDEFAFGLRGQGVLSSLVQDYGSVCVTGDYYLPFSASKNGFRVFAGAGAGIYTSTTSFLFSKNNDVTTSSFGFFPRIGFEVRHFRLSAEYNYTGGPTNYAAVNVGFFLGGGAKK